MFHASRGTIYSHERPQTVNRLKETARERERKNRERERESERHTHTEEERKRCSARAYSAQESCLVWRAALHHLGRKGLRLGGSGFRPSFGELNDIGALKLEYGFGAHYTGPPKRYR